MTFIIAKGSFRHRTSNQPDKTFEQHMQQAPRPLKSHPHGHTHHLPPRRLAKVMMSVSVATYCSMKRRTS
jgi:hypothetical protein